MNIRAWITRLFQGINQSYEERIRAASEVTDYGSAHPHDSAHAAQDPAAEADADETVAEIINVPRGTRLDRSTSAETPAASEAPDTEHS